MKRTLGLHTALAIAGLALGGNGIAKTLIEIAPEDNGLRSLNPNIDWTGSGVRISWHVRVGFLEKAQSLDSGEWTPVPATASHTQYVEPTQVQMFYRLNQIDRSVMLQVPDSYDGTMPIPLIVSLHGALSSAEGQESRNFPMGQFVDEKGFALLVPEGTWDTGIQAGDGLTWNVTDACCKSGIAREFVDDVAYIASLIEAVRHEVVIDGNRIYVIGTSNGGFLAHRIACEMSEVVAAIVSHGGAMDMEIAQCNADFPVHILEIHSTTDEVVEWDGGNNSKFLKDPTQYPADDYPGTLEGLARWAALQGCTGALVETGRSFDLFADRADAVELIFETSQGGDVHLWRHEGSHFVSGLTGLSQAVWNWLDEHPKKWPPAGLETLP